MSDFVSKVKEFNELAGTEEKFNVKMVSLYTGLVLEEVAEMLAALNIESGEKKGHGIHFLIERLNLASAEFKTQKYSDTLGDTIDRVAFLDGAVDVAVVAIGAGISNGSDVLGACNHVADTNLAKFPLVDGKRIVLKNEQGKIQKPEGWKPPELAQFLHPRNS